MLCHLPLWCKPVHDAPPWRKCICYCNPCWCDDDDRYIDYDATGDDGSDSDNTSHLDRDDIKEMASLHSIKTPVTPTPTTTTESPRSLTSVVELSPRQEDTFVLAENYNALEEYEKQFGEFDRVTGERKAVNQQESSGGDGSTTVRVKHDETTMREVSERLDANNYGKSSALQSDLNLLFIMVRQSPACSTERREMIERYERYHHTYRDHALLSEDRHMADFALSGARNETQWSTRELRLENYRKAIFFTHNEVNKLQLKKEYRAYCETIMAKKSV